MGLRQYQIKSINELREAIRSGHRRLILQAPTGSGKTQCACEIIRLAEAMGKRTLFVTHLRELILQGARKLREYGINPGVIMAGEEPAQERLTQVASIQTIWARAFRRTRMDLPGADIVIIDEAHASASNSYQKLIQSYPGAIILGLTATPIRSDGKGLGDTYTHMVRTASVRELTEQGFLVPLNYFSPSVPDLTGVKVTAGDYNKGQLEKAMDKVKLVGDVVENWARIADNRPTVVFASGVRHSIHIRDAFLAAGIPAVHLDASTPKDARECIIERFNAGEVQVLCNVGVLKEGSDIPRLACCVLARPTKSLGCYIQMVGRVMRPFPGKKDAQMIDHSGCFYEHGRIADHEDWVLERGTGMRDRAAAKKKAKGKEITCSSCKFVYHGYEFCPNCGNKPKDYGKGIEYRDGYLHEVGAGAVPDKHTKEQWFRQLLGYAMQKHYSPGWAAHCYRSKFGVWPRSLSRRPAAPGDEVLAYINKKNDQYRRSKINGNGVLPTLPAPGQTVG